MNSTSRYRAVFSRRHVVLPVIHVLTVELAKRNAMVAREAGADGVFLINHNGSWTDLLRIHGEVMAVVPDWWVGVNFLDLDPESAFGKLPPTVAGLWTDNAEVDERSAEQMDAQWILKAQGASGWPGLYFGGVAFKYQRLVSDLAGAGNAARQFMDVVTTSGPGTGRRAEVEKIRAMKQALGEFPLAIASGITPENVGDYLEVADCFLVATGVSKNFYELNPARVKALVERVRAFAAA